ncbi:Gamma-glutamyltranspeptidase 1 [Smittium culicis]|uniref:Glutathione hydrolase n=1 Tax=Smittium culicis TaxID=133412 RepID=A0A1R1YBH8_9FUNG|nr:Gamma-glutamyltranspeptidase 1 [Smittium culicis]OMJ24287.1 Gamma-glutamyltranspeptidase 1 [Smittium culicis]
MPNTHKLDPEDSSSSEILIKHSQVAQSPKDIQNIRTQSSNKGLVFLTTLALGYVIYSISANKIFNLDAYRESVFEEARPAFLFQDSLDQDDSPYSIEEFSNAGNELYSNPPIEGNPDIPDGEGIVINSKQAFGKNGAVATDEARCSQIGVNALKEGGSAVDAAIASALCVGLLNSFSAGIGGGGFMLVRKPNGESDVIDFREMAPISATKEMFIKNITKAQIGGLSIAIPGEIKGFELAHKRYGKLKWSRLFEPTIKLARDGYKIGKMLGIHLKSLQSSLAESEAFKEVFFDSDGKVLKEGDIAKRQNFANTLQKIADYGADAFYNSELTTSMVDTIKKNNGILTEADFKSYRAITRKPLTLTYHNRKVITCPPPTSGSIFASIINILEGYNMKDLSNKAVNIHRMIEAFKFGYAQRSNLGDPAFVNVEEVVQNNLSKDFAAGRREKITDNTTHDYKYYEPDHDIDSQHGTTHLSVLDKDDMAVSLTSTINLLFGSRVMDKTSGVIFNDHMDDFSTPKLKNAFGLYPSPKNFIAPGKRPLSTTSAVIIENNGKVEFVLGASGGSRILTSTTQVFLNMVEFNSTLKQAVDAPRVHHQLLPEKLLVEPYYSNKILNELKQRNHKFGMMNQGTSVVQGVRKLTDGTFNSVSDGRKFGAPAAY